MARVIGSATHGTVLDTPARDGGGISAASFGVRTLAALTLLLQIAWPPDKAAAQTATELMEQARRYDSGCNVGPHVDRRKAIELYEKALTAGPDRQQRLQALFRMAQLHGCIFDPQKGEKPDHSRAIALYRQIADSYPPQEPMVMTALGLISDHYTTLQRHEAALTWARRAVEYDTARVEEHLQNVHRRQDSLAATRYSPEERREIMEQAVRSGMLQEELERMKAGRVAAVDRVASAARKLGPFLEQEELKAIADRYRGTPVGDRAAQRLQAALDRQRDLWAPVMEPPADPASTVQPAHDAPGLLPQGRQDVQAPREPHTETTRGSRTPAPHNTQAPMGAVPPAKSPRAPPLILISACVIVAAGAAVRKIRRKTLSRDQEHET